MANKVLDKDNIDVIIYHGWPNGGCYDGYGCTFTILHYYKKFHPEKKLELIPRSVFLKEEEELDTELQDAVRDKNVIMCDFSYKFKHLIQIIELSKTFCILDHHKTAQADLMKIPLELKIFDMDRSGVGITWAYFFPDTPLPRFLACIQDRDLWTANVPQSNEFVAYFYEQPHHYDLWETYLADEVVDTAIAIGSQWLQYKSLIVAKCSKRANWILQEYQNRYVIVAYCNSTEFASDIGNKMLTQYPHTDFSVVWSYDLYLNKTTYSLRSTNEKVDVSAVAKKFGGGGHRNASGATMNSMQCPLPLEQISDHGILAFLMDRTVETLTVAKQEYTYSLFGSKEDDAALILMEEKYLQLIKRNASDANFIVFDCPTASVKYNEQTKEVIPLHDYWVVYNEESVKSADTQLLLSATGSLAQHLNFTTDQDFTTVFRTKLEATTKPGDDAEWLDWSDNETDETDETDAAGNELI